MKILLVTGASAGHILPALWTGETLMSRGHDVVLAGQWKRFSFLADKWEGAFESIVVPEPGAFRRAPMRALWEGWQGWQGALSLVSRVQPDAVAAFGGRACFFCVMAARVKGRPVLLHEQNVQFGRANRWLMPWVQRVAVSFSETLSQAPSGKSVLTGCPCRERSDMTPAQARQQLGLEEGVFTLLIMGGSQGSRVINQTFLDGLDQLKDEMPLQVIHCAGHEDELWVKSVYETEDVRSVVFAFSENMTACYAAADLVIARAGSLSIHEIGLFKRPAILIPYPYAGAHQIENAKAFLRREAGCLIEEKDLTPESLVGAIIQSARGIDRGKDTKESTWILTARERLADEIESLAAR